MLITFIQSSIFTLCVGIVFLALTIALAITSSALILKIVAMEERIIMVPPFNSEIIASPTKTQLCQAVEQGKYDKINKLLEPNSDFGEIIIKDDVVLMSGKQLKKIFLINAKCAFRENPFIGIVFWYAEAFNKFLSLPTNS